MADFFISYTSIDKTWAEWIGYVLEEEGFAVIVQAWDFRPGSNFVLEMQRATAEADRTIMVVSPDYMKSQFTLPEWAVAFAQDPQGVKRKLVPVVVHSGDLTGLLASVVYINLSNLDEAAARSALISGLNKQRGKPAKRPFFPGREHQLARKLYPGASAGNSIATSATRAAPAYDAEVRDHTDQPHYLQRETRPLISTDLALDRLRETLETGSGKTLISDIVSNKWGEEELEAVTRDAEYANRALRAIVESSPEGLDTWSRMLFVEISARIADPTESILSIAFKSQYHWGIKSGVLQALRFVGPRVRQQTLQQLVAYSKQGDFDTKRLAIQGLGFLGDITNIQWRSDEERVGKDKYATSKLGSYVAFACLDCFSHFADDARHHSPLDSMEAVLDEMKTFHVPDIHPLNFAQRLQGLRPGLAPELLNHAANSTHRAELQGVLYAMDGKVSPYTAETLYAIAIDPDMAVSDSALMALASTPGDNSIRLLEAAVSLNLNGATEALLLGIGFSKALDQRDLVVKYLAPEFRGKSGGNTAAFALWAAGELAQSDQNTFIPLLQAAAKLSEFPRLRGYAYLGMAKAGVGISESELLAAADYATNFLELLTIGIASLFSGQGQLMERGIHATQANHAPIWRLQGHLYRDVCAGLSVGLGEPGRLLLRILARGDLD